MSTKIIKALVALLFLEIIAFASNSYAIDYNNTSEIQILLRNTENQLNITTATLKSLQDNCASLSHEVNNLKKDLAIEKQQNDRLEKEITELKQETVQNNKQIQSNMNSMVNKIAQQTTKAINTATYKENAKTANNGPVGSGEFYEYKVQEGATLHTIAKAYHVNVDSIRKANNLKNSTIRTGQTLYIPKK